MCYNLNTTKEKRKREKTMITETNKRNVVFTLENWGLSRYIECKRTVKSMKRSLLDIIFKRPGVPIYEKTYETSTLSKNNSEIAEIEQKAFDYLKEHLDENELACFFIVGYTPSQKPLSKADFSKKPFSYEDMTRLYGCYKNGRVTNYINNTGESASEPAPQYKIIVTYMEKTLENELCLPYNTEMIKYRCEQMKIDSSYIVGRGTFTTDELKNEIFLNEYCKKNFFDKGIPAVVLHVQSYDDTKYNSIITTKTFTKEE